MVPFLLCGPLLRRTERSDVYVWVATAKETTDITALVYDLSKDANGKWNGTAVNIESVCTTYQLGERLFVSLIQMRLPQGGRFDVNRPYGYDLKFQLKNQEDIYRFSFPEEPTQKTSLQQFLFSEIYNHSGHFSYAGMPYPVFVVPDTSKSKTSIIYGSCRRTSGPGSDALNAADKMLVEEWKNWAPTKKESAPAYVLFHTGDQIYTDDLSRELFTQVISLATYLMGGSIEMIPCYTSPALPPKKDLGILDLLDFLQKYIDGVRGYDIRDLKVLRWIEYGEDLTEVWRKENVILLIKEYLSVIYSAEYAKQAEPGFLSGKTSLKSLVFASILKVIDFSPVNGKMPDMDDALAQLDSDDRVIDTNEIMPRPYMLDPSIKSSLMGSHQFIYEQRKSFVRINTSFTTTDDGHLLTFGEIAALYLLNWGTFYVQLPPVGDINKGNLEGLKTGNLRVRRLMANVPNYMMFDDHDVTDDWNGDETWRTRVEKSDTGRRIIANSLAAFWAFQGWGNTPTVFYNSKMVDAIKAHLGYFAQRGKESPSLVKNYEEETWKFNRWTYVAPTNPLAVFMDTRTMREKEAKMDYQPEYLPDTQLNSILDFLTDAAVLTAVGSLYKDQAKKAKVAAIILSFLMMRDVGRKQHRNVDELKNDFLAVNMFKEASYRELYAQLLAAGYKPGQTIIFCAATPVISGYLLQKAQKTVVEGSFNKKYVALKLFSTFVKPGRYSQDWELWWCHPRGKYEFFKFLDLTLRPGKVIILSGDVHVGFHITASLTSEISGRRIKVEQICSSALKNNQLGKQSKTDKLAYVSMEDTKDVEFKKILEHYPVAGLPVKKNHFIFQGQMRKYKPIMDPDSWIIWENNVGVLHYSNERGEDNLQNEFLFSKSYDGPVVVCKSDPVSPEKDAFINHLANFIPVADALLIWEALKAV